MILEERRRVGMARKIDVKESLNIINELGEIAAWTLNQAGEVWWCDALYDLYGIEKGSKETNMQAFQDKVYQPDLEKFNSIIDAALNDLMPFVVEVRVKIKYEYQWVRISGKPDGRGGLIGCTQNINNLYRTARENLQLLQVLEALILGNGATMDELKQVLKNG